MTVLREHYRGSSLPMAAPQGTHGDGWEADVEREVAHTTR